MSSRKKANKLNSKWIAHSREMRESLAWRYLPDNARRVLDRLELEHMNHGGAENGRLPCTYDDFAKWGIRRQSVSKAIRQCEVLGFIEVTVRGGRSRAENRWPSLYRLTYPNGTSSSAQPIDDWRSIKTAAEAVAALHHATRKSESRVQKRTTLGRGKIAPSTNRLPGARMHLLS